MKKALVIEGYDDLREMLTEELQQKFQFEVQGLRNLFLKDQAVGPFDLIICEQIHCGQNAYEYFIELKKKMKLPLLFYITNQSYHPLPGPLEKTLKVDQNKNLAEIFLTIENLFQNTKNLT